MKLIPFPPAFIFEAKRTVPPAPFFNLPCEMPPRQISPPKTKATTLPRFLKPFYFLARGFPFPLLKPNVVPLVQGVFNFLLDLSKFKGFYPPPPPMFSSVFSYWAASYLCSGEFFLTQKDQNFPPPPILRFSITSTRTPPPWGSPDRVGSIYGYVESHLVVEILLSSSQ